MAAIFRINGVNIKRLLQLDLDIDENYVNRAKSDMEKLYDFREKDEYRNALEEVIKHLILQEPNRWNDMCAHLPLFPFCSFFLLLINC